MDINELQSYSLDDAVKFNERLNPRLWGRDEHLLPEVREKLMAIAADFKEFLGIDLEVKDITVSGSNAAYTYTPHSDIDLHLVADLPRGDSDEVYRELFDAKKYQYNDEHDYKIGGYDVELYVQDANKPHHSQGIYSVLNNDWVRVPSRKKPTVDDISVKSKYEDIGRRIDAAIESGDLGRMDAMAKKIRDMRQAGLDEHGEFGPENLAFKVLRGNGTLQRLRDARLAAKDQEMSLKERSRVRYGFRKTVADEDYDPNAEPPGPESKPEMPPGTVLVNVSDVYDWYKLGQDISDLEHANPAAYGKGAPQTILSFGSEPVEHMYKKNLDRLGLKTLDIDRNAKVKDPEAAYRMDEDQDVTSVLKDFVDFVIDKLGIEHAPKIKIKRDPAWSKRNNTFGRYVPEEDTLYVSVANRHALDIMRTIAHELTHHRQEEVSPMPDEAGITGSPWEDEANAMAGRIMREFGEQNPHLFSSDDIGEGLGSKLAGLGTAACIAGTPGCATNPTAKDVAQGVQTVGRTAQTFKGMKAGDAREELTTALKDYLRRGTGTRESRVNEASGYIPTEREKDDPRYKMALTVDVHPGETGRQANKLGLKTDSQGRPALLMKKLANLLESVKNDEAEDLFEVKMSPGELQKWAESDEAQGIQAGFEAELIFRDTARDDGDSEDYVPDYDQDERAYSIRQVVEFFQGGDNGISPREARSLSTALQEEYYEWRDEAINDAWEDDAEQLVRDYMEENVWEDEQDERIRNQAEEMFDGEDVDAIMTAGEQAPKFTKLSDQEAYAKDNELYQRYQEALDAARAEFEEEVEREINERGGYWDEASENFADMAREDGPYDEEAFFQDNYRYMTDIENAHALHWPYYTGSNEPSGGGREPQGIADSLRSTLNLAGIDNTGVVAGGGYHSTARKPGRWIIEPDGSLDPDDYEDAGLEVVSPPMPLPEAMKALRTVIDWANSSEGDAYTNSSTGLHMGVSIPHKGGAVDYVKLVLFMGDQHVLDQFDRAANTYCASALEKLRQTQIARRRGLREQDVQGWDRPASQMTGAEKTAAAMDLMRKNLVELAQRYVQDGVGQSKYTSAHIKDGYIEFRSPGGDYLSMDSRDEQALGNTMLRFARAMYLAGRPDLERKEYSKKLYKLLSGFRSAETARDTKRDTKYRTRIETEGANDALELFAKYSSGMINSEELKKQWAEQVLAKEAPLQGSPEDGKEYEVFDKDTDKVISTFRAYNDQEALKQTLRRWSDKGINYGVRKKKSESEPEKPLSRRAQVAKRIKERPTVWHVEDTNTGRVLLIAAETIGDAKWNAKQQDPGFERLDREDPDSFFVHPASAAEVKQYQEKMANQQQDSAQVQQRVQGPQDGRFSMYRVRWTERRGGQDVNDSLRVSAANADSAMASVRGALQAQGREITSINAVVADSTEDLAQQRAAQSEPDNMQPYNIIWKVRERFRGEDNTRYGATRIRAASPQQAETIWMQSYREENPNLIDFIEVQARPVSSSSNPRSRAATPGQSTDDVTDATRNQQPAGEFTGRWQVKNTNTGEVLYTFGGVGNNQGDANRVAQQWVQRSRIDDPVEVVPEMGRGD